jgi:hypothetical protein
VIFKKVFGEHKNLVISLLNALLPLDEGKQIESIEYMPPEMEAEFCKRVEVDNRRRRPGMYADDDVATGTPAQGSPLGS